MIHPAFMVKSAKVLQVPSDETRINEDGEEVPARFFKVGVRVTMEDGSYWVNSFRSGSWTNHWTTMKPSGPGYTGMRMVPVECKQTFTPRQLEREYAGRRALLDSLELGVALAYAELG